MKATKNPQSGEVIPSTIAQEARWRAVLDRDAREDGRFFYGVPSTGVFCRPSCPSRRPRRDGVRFFATAAEAEGAGFRACLRCRPLERDRHAVLIEKLCRHIQIQAGEPSRLALLSELAGVTPFHLQRLFKKILGITPREYADACRIRALKQKLQAGQSVTRALFDAGYGSTSRLYERSDLRLGMTPATYGCKGRGARIRYALADSALGKVLVAATVKGICALKFGNSDRELAAALKSEFAEAELIRDQESLGQWLIAVVRFLGGLETHLSLPTEVRATAFQSRVWKHLQTIAPGTTQSYALVAKALGQPTAARAVARACASNPVAVLIPCHRVIRQDGGLGGYRWGLKRKEKLLAQERQRHDARKSDRQMKTAKHS